MTGALAPLEEVLAVRDDDVVDRFCEEWDVAREEAEALFTDLLRWLWLNARCEDVRLTITEPLLALDEMWHTFVLFTAAYERFCTRYLGCFLHHHPGTRASRDAERALWAADPVAAEARWEARERAQHQAVFEHFGEETLLRWYVDLPTRFDEDFFRGSRKVRSIRFRPSDQLRALRSPSGAADGSGAADACRSGHVALGPTISPAP